MVTNACDRGQPFVDREVLAVGGGRLVRCALDCEPMRRPTFTPRTTVLAVALVGFGFLGGWLFGRSSSNAPSAAKVTRGSDRSPKPSGSPAATPGVKELNYGDVLNTEVKTGSGTATLSVELLGIQGLDSGSPSPAASPRKKSARSAPVPTQGRFVAVQVRVENEGPTPYRVAPSNFVLEEAESEKVYQVADVKHEPRLESRSLAAGEELSGWVVFDIPRGGRWVVALQESRRHTTLARWQVEL